MSGDYSRHRFNPRNHYAGVRMQQGRVQLDADWNEWTDAIDRRTRAETVDTFGVFFTPGIDGVAVVSPQTPDAFLIEVNGGGIDIGQGRMYVDGLLAENFGDPDGPQNFDPLLAELRGQNPLAYTKQPFHPAPAGLPTGGTHLAYLEVWQREVGHLQRPDLVEIAVGVDTTTRTQTAWQVRLLEDIGGSVDCSSPDSGLGGGWADVIAPSAGRLSSRDVGVPPDLDPCELPPGGGYRGLENQLYRIEIQHGGGIGEATFKWSRDNASVAASVVEVVSSTKLKLASLGRDAVLRFSTGDWVEIIDDWRELSGKDGDPAKRFGEMRKITDVNDESQTISFGTALPADLVPTGTGDDTLEKRHLRVVRWDQKGVVRDATNGVVVDLDGPGSATDKRGLIPVPAAGTWVALENGVQVSFSRDPSTGDFRCNDFWNVAARTADASAEILTEAPPQGIHRHYARLALVTFPDGETDCRIHWPPDFGGGCCTFIVEPGDDIQAAIDALGEDGGCICIKTGVHDISKPLRIENSNIVMHGESAGSRIRRENGVSMLVLDNPKGITLHDVKVQGIRFESGAKPSTKDAHPDIILFSRRCARFHLQDCALVPQKFNFVTGAWFGGLEDGVIENCEIGPVGMGVWVDEESTGLAVLDSRLNAEYFDGVDGGSIGIWLRDAYGASRIERNQIRNFLSGVYVNHNSTDEPPYSNASGTVVIGNRIERSAKTGGSEKEPHIFGIEFAAHRGLIRDNVLGYASAAYGGIRVCGRQVLVENNRLDCEFRPPPDGTNAFPIGIQLGCLAEKVTNAGESGVLHGNRLNGSQDAILVLAASRSEITGNRVDGGKTGARYGVAAADGAGIEIAGNEFLDTAFALGLMGCEDCGVNGNQAHNGKLGVLGFQQAGLKIHGNHIGNQSAAGMLFAGLTGSTSIIGNRVEACAFEGLGSLGAPGLFIFGAAGRVHIGDCEIVDTGVSPDQSQVRQPAYGIFGLFLQECLVQGNRVTYENPALEKRSDKGEDRALWLIGYLDLEVPEQVHWGFPAQVVDNSFSGPGMSSLVEFQQLQLTDRIFIRFERVTFSNNHCWHWSLRRGETGGTVSLCGHRAIVMGNHVKANSPIPSFNFNGMTGIYVGNDTTGPVAGFADFPTPSNSFNRQ